MNPPEDRARSPHTGWTRAHWTAVADRMLAATDRYRSPLGARIDLPGPHSAYGPASDGLEGYARTLLLAGFRLAGERGADPTGLAERYAAGLAAGTDPHSPEAWPRPDELGQAKVEAASIALILQLTRPWLWDRLDDGVRERTVAWLATVVGQPYPPINWVWFRVVVESFLREVGGPWSATDIEEDLAVHASLRRAGGWLSDGAEQRAYDHYTGWALHLYPLLWTRAFDVTGTLCPPELRRVWEADLTAYLRDAVHLLGADGSPLLQGRSLVYRFAAAAPLWTAAYAGVGDLPPGQLRRAASGILKHFHDRGAPDPADGLLSLGWHHPWPAMKQSYSGPGSPYWAAKGMLGLALPADHPVWTDVEERLPVERGDFDRLVEAPGWLVSGRRETGVITVVNHGTDHARAGDVLTDAPLYARLGYATATVPPLVGDTVDAPVDNAVVLLDSAGRASHRTGFTTRHTGRAPGGVLLAVSGGPAHWLDPASEAGPDHGSGRAGAATVAGRLTVASVLRDGRELRLVRVADAAPGARVRLGGWPLTAAEPPAPAPAPAGLVAAARDGRLRSAVRALRGFAEAGVWRADDVTPLGPHTAVPWVATADGPPADGLLAALVTLDAADGGADPAPAEPPRVEVAGERVTVHWPDGLTTEVPV
ncbi:DUF2264 domain-containing protein [Streptomyces sp. DSM 44915]|uniref:DUF2264 domain-containing protein n=1 Tax=Streptomyces chisholmiae TaxID=3075540 RepID=A0ABU2JV45_9ACTN|nr:DUF2264 domain-containing protein [Streptomyces sp. DSM 44915]MDT0268820.1 DUF2264 domain-containing protein [Streptomyces sp. DSM 44915]